MLAQHLGANKEEKSVNQECLSAPFWSKPIVERGRPSSKLELSITALEADTRLSVFNDHRSDPFPVS